MAFAGQSITLGRAAGGVGLGAFNPVIFQGRVEIVFPECGPVGQAQDLHQALTAQFTGPNRLAHRQYLVGYLVGGHGFANNLTQGAEHELGKGRGMTYGPVSRERSGAGPRAFRPVIRPATF